MVEERARRGLGVPDVKFTTGFTPNLRVGTANNLAFESKFIGVLSVERCDAHARAISEPTNTECWVTLADIAAYWIKVQRTRRVKVRDEPDAMCASVGVGVRGLWWSVSGGSLGTIIACLDG